jgi:UDP-N-acetylmuramate-alanine ligase
LALVSGLMFIQALQQDLAEADIAYVAPVYPAGEEPIPGVDHTALVAGMKARGHRAAREIAGADALAETLADEIQPGDMVVLDGEAGTIYADSPSINSERPTELLERVAQWRMQLESQQ